MNQELKTQLDTLIAENNVVLFMKGTTDFPMCGFSAATVGILEELDVPFQDINVMVDENIRQGIKEYSNWPTIPQVYINGEFIGGSDILIKMYEDGNLQQTVEVALAS
mgnify:CR=1 FL=1